MIWEVSSRNWYRESEPIYKITKERHNAINRFILNRCRRYNEFCPSVRGSREGGGVYIVLVSWIPHGMLQVEWHAFGMPPGNSLVAVWEFRVLLPQGFKRGRDERDYHTGDEVGHGNRVSHAATGARPIAGEVPDSRVSELSSYTYSHGR